MTVRNLDALFQPRSVVFVGASPEPGTVGETIVKNLMAGGFGGKILLVNPRHSEIHGQPCYKSIDDLPVVPELAVVATPAKTVPDIIAQLGKKGVRAAVVVTAGLGPLKATMLENARPYCLRILGPNGIGLMLPTLGLNASFAHRDAPKGTIAFLSQSGALLTTVIDWAAGRDIGFSHVVSLGDMSDVDFGDLLDYFAGDMESRAILIYMEALTNASKFISAARRAARVKPVIVVKSGRHEAGARAAMSHTGALAGSDAAYDAAFRRTGLLRVQTLPDMFAAAEVLARRPRLHGERLTILTNGGGAGVLAVDALQDEGGIVAPLEPETKAKLDAVLPAGWSGGNPVDIIGDAGPERYRAAMDTLLEDKSVDAILVMQCPTALADPLANAQAVLDEYHAQMRDRSNPKPMLTCWLGEGSALASRELFVKDKIPTFETPSDAIVGFMQLVRYARAQQELIQTPDAGPKFEADDDSEVTRIIASALSEGRDILNAIEAKAVLAAEGIPVAETIVARNAVEVEAAAAQVLVHNAACVIKILSPDISHKSDVGGVRLGLESAKAAAIAAQEMMERVASVRPDAKIEGFMVEAMIRRSGAHETIVGMSEDRTFGPMILFGAGGTAVEVVADRALALPPLDDVLARQMIKETRISKLLKGYRNTPPANVAAIADTLVKISHLVVRHPEIRELDINPLIVDEEGVLALDARIRVADEKLKPRMPLAIRPYPLQWETRFDIAGVGEVSVRPVRPEDERLYEKFFSNISSEDVRMRFFTPRVALSHQFLARLTQIDYAREMAFVALAPESGELLGVVRLVLDPDLTTGEYGILLRSDQKGRGLGWRLMQHLITYARAEGVRSITGLVLSENTTMIEMARRLGFKMTIGEDDPEVVEVRLDL
ncbi:MAG: bifunctional acetate--CoA ligase family protein/GNAT family N-acetyltransferase [Hyphomicrobiaceae bacterium]|nr:bifunctional acetate--CoA ligase family protein/GNAT family N-acetyltransferase [Hyphomicrobiaceae bacterium]